MTDRAPDGPAEPGPLRVKLDENMPVDAAALFRGAGHACDTVYDEGLAGAPDPAVAAACGAERRVLVTLDLDFADVRAYPPGTHPGIIVLRPGSPDRDSVLALVRTVVATRSRLCRSIPVCSMRSSGVGIVRRCRPRAPWKCHGVAGDAVRRDGAARPRSPPQADVIAHRRPRA